MLMFESTIRRKLWQGCKLPLSKINIAAHLQFVMNHVDKTTEIKVCGMKSLI